MPVTSFPKVLLGTLAAPACVKWNKFVNVVKKIIILVEQQVHLVGGGFFNSSNRNLCMTVTQLSFESLLVHTNIQVQNQLHYPKLVYDAKVLPY